MFKNFKNKLPRKTQTKDIIFDSNCDARFIH